MSNFTVWTGLWRDHSLHGLAASKLTVTVPTGSLITSALATFITLVGARFWSIVAYTTHQLRATVEDKDGVHHQHQVVYRNASSHLAAAWDILRIGWSWRWRAPRIVPRTIAFTVLPLLSFAVFAIASVFSAKTAAPAYLSSRVIVKSHACGFTQWLIPDGQITQSGSGIFADWSMQKGIRALNYARSCYGVKDAQFTSCDYLPVSKLPYVVSASSDCPFRNNRCELGPKTALEMSTPWLDSHIHFGINDVPHNRVKYRRVATCSILRVNDLVSNYSTQLGTTYNYNLGRLFRSPLDTPTFFIPDHVQNDGCGYNLRTYVSVAGTVMREWEPVPDLETQNGDLSIVFFTTNSVRYSKPVEDPMFLAHRVATYPTTNTTVYTADELVKVLACVDQSQFRDPRTDKTTPLAGYMATNSLIQSMGLNEQQRAAANRLIEPALITMMSKSIGGLGSTALKAQSNVFIILSNGVQVGQWKIELQGWFETALAGLQHEVMDFVSKEVAHLAPYAESARPPAGSSLDATCRSQTVRNTGQYQTFSVLGIGVILVGGALISLISLTLEPIVNTIRKRLHRSQFKSTMWRMDFVLQQQRIAFEKSGLGKWTRLDKNIPVTQDAELFSRRP